MPLLLGNHGQFRTGVSASTPAASVDPALLAWYQFNDSAAADGTSANGGTLTNSGSGGSALNAAIQYCTWQPGYTGRALRWTPRAEASNTLTDRASVTSSALNLTTGGTIMCRLKCSSATDFNEYGILGLVDSSENQVFTLFSNKTTVMRTAIRITRTINGVPTADVQNTGFTLSSASIPINQWNHYAATFDRTNLRLYVNGTQRSTLTLAAASNFTYTGNLSLSLGWISFGNQSPGYGWNGDADDFRLYTSTLSAAEIAAIAAQ